MYTYEGTNAVSNARTAISIFAILFLIVGIVLIVFGITDYEDWAITVGLSLAGGSIPLFILNAVLKGFQSITRACETYLKDKEKKEFLKEEEHSIDAALKHMENIKANKEQQI